jgi:hypothetical protein
MTYFTEPMNSLMYWIKGAATVLHTTMHHGVVVPTNPLVTEITLSQVSQLSQEDEAREGEDEVAALATYRLDETQAFSMLMPTFNNIVSVTQTGTQEC